MECTLTKRISFGLLLWKKITTVGGRSGNCFFAIDFHLKNFFIFFIYFFNLICLFFVFLFCATVEYMSICCCVPRLFDTIFQSLYIQCVNCATFFAKSKRKLLFHQPFFERAKILIASRVSFFYTMSLTFLYQFFITRCRVKCLWSIVQKALWLRAFTGIYYVWKFKLFILPWLKHLHIKIYYFVDDKRLTIIYTI